MSSDLIVLPQVSPNVILNVGNTVVLTPNRAVITDSNGMLDVSVTTATEVSFLSGVTSSVQTQLNGKQPLDADLTAIAGLSATGFSVRTASNTWSLRSITAGSGISITNGDGVSGNPSISIVQSAIDHGSISGLGDDDHSQYFLLAGRSGSQTAIGGTAASENLNLSSTANATKGKINFGVASTYDEANDRLGIGINSPTVKIHQNGGTGTATYHKFTAGTTTGTSVTDGLDIGIDSSGRAEIRQRENLPITFFTNNSPSVRIQEGGRLTAGDVDEGFPFFTNYATKFLVNDENTNVANDGVLFSDVIQILACSSLDVNPSADTNSGAVGATLYAAQGFTADMVGTVDYQGFAAGAGSAYPSVIDTASVIGAFGQVNVATVSGSSADSAIGVLCAINHQGEGGQISSIIGGDFVANTDTNNLGSVTTMIGGRFSAVTSGVAATTQIAGQFFQPKSYDSGLGTPATAANRVAIDCRGTIAFVETQVASAASITNMPVESSFVYLTGATATTLHSISRDTFCKYLILVNRTGANLTIKHESTTEGTAARRIVTSTGADVVSTGNSAHHFIYSTTAQRWILIGGDL